MNAIVLTVLWLVLIGAVGHFIWNVPFFGRDNFIRVLVVFGFSGVLPFAAYDSVQERRTADAVREERDGARYDIVSVNFVDVGKSPDADWPFFNFYYKNNGTLAAQGVMRRPYVVTSDTALKKEEVDSHLRTAGDFHYVFDPEDEIQPQGEGNFSEPNKPGLEAENMARAIAKAKQGTTLVYIFLVTKYRDPMMSANKIRVSDFCVFFNKQTEVSHYCRQNNVHLESIK
jgi:hypothetical protein